MGTFNSRFPGLAALVLLGLLLASPAAAVHQKILVPYPAPGQRDRLFFNHDLELMGDADGAYVLLSRPDLTDELRARGFQVQVLVPDLEAEYASRNKGARGYGIWHDYQATVAEMNLLHSQFPELAAAPESIGATVEGRTIWAMKISDHPELEEDEPEVLFDGVHHAREIMTVEDLLHLMRYLCENYATGPVVRSIVEHRQVWFVPIINVDGFVYNQQTNPNGGGLWRKNRRPGPGGCNGVDLNRNYPFVWMGVGSSTDPCMEDYRGASPASEPETRTMTRFVNRHHFVVWQSYHSVAGMVLIPWGHTTSPTEDDSTFKAIGREMARDNAYAVGQPINLLYPVNGSALDWGYGATDEHAKIFTFTTEVGGSDFWPRPEERDPLIAENLHADLFLCQIAGATLELESLEVAGADGNGRLEPGESASFVVHLRNSGLLATARGVRARLSCRDPYVTLDRGEILLGDVSPQASASSDAAPVSVQVEPSCPPGREIAFQVHIEAGDEISQDLEVSLTVGRAPLLYADDFEQPGSEWLRDPTDDARTGQFVRIIPVATDEQPGEDATPGAGVYAWMTAQNPDGANGTDDVDDGMAATRSPEIDLSGLSHARLEMEYFFGQQNSGDDPGGDFFRIDLSNDGGATFPVNLVEIGDVASAPVWRPLKADLENLLPLTAHMVLRVQVADGPAHGDVIEGGIDEVYITGGTGDRPPSAPVAALPTDGAADQPCNPTLVVENAADPEGNRLTYGFRVYADAAMTRLLRSADGIPQGAGSSTWTVVPALPQGEYFWYAFAADAEERGLTSEPSAFTVSSTPGLGPCDTPLPMVLDAGPNPSSGVLLLRYYTPSTADSRLEIYNPLGRRIRTLPAAHWSEGWQETAWDGNDDAGHAAGAGVYWVRLSLPEESRTVRLVRIR